MWETVIASSVLILAIIAVRFLLKGELSRRVGYALWLLAAARLLVPVSLASSSLSVLNLVPQVELPDRGSIYISSQGITATQPPPQEGWEAGVSDFDADGRYAPAGDRYQLYYPPKSEDFVFNPVGETPPEDYTTVPASHILPTPKPALTAVWYAGMAAVGAWFVWVNRSFRKKLRSSARPLEVPGCPLKVYVAEGISSPCLAGLLRPAIYVTPACAEDEARLRHVLAHELTHWRHKDPLWSLVRCACLTVYWFHPLVWLAGFLSRRDCELACDEGTLERLGEEERLAYGRTLIGLVEISASPAHLLQTATTMVDRKKGVKERLLFIAQKPRVVAAAGVFAVLIAAVAAACAFTGAAEPDRLTVEEALADIPAELTAPEDSFERIVAFTAENSSKLEEGELLRGYWGEYFYLSTGPEWPLGWLASVYRMDQAAYDALAEGRSDAGQTDARWECFARDRDFYYLIHAPMTVPIIKVILTAGANIPANGPELQERLVEWLKAAVLSADGVEAFDGKRLEYTHQGLAYATVEEALADMPAELGPTEDAPLDGVVTYTPKDSSEFFALEEGELLRGYWRTYMTLSSNLERPLGWLASLYRLDEAAYEEFMRNIEVPNTYKHCFATDGTWYYIFYAPITAPELKEGLTEGAELQARLVEWLRSAVLSVNGVEAFRGNYSEHPEPAAQPEPTDPLTALVRAIADGINFDTHNNAEAVTFTLTRDGESRTYQGTYDANSPGDLAVSWEWSVPDEAEEFSEAGADWTLTVTSGDGRVSLLLYPGTELVRCSVDGTETVLRARYKYDERTLAEAMRWWFDSSELEGIRARAVLAPGDPDWPDDPTPAAIARVLSQKYFGAYTQVSHDSPYRLESVEVLDNINVFDMDDFLHPTIMCFGVGAALGGKVLDDMGGWQAGQGMEYQESGRYAGKWLQGYEATAQMDETGRWVFLGAGSGGASVDYSTEQLTQEELDWFNTAFFNGIDERGVDAERMMNNMLLRRPWSGPEDIDLFGLFYNGLGTPGGDRSQLTGEELAQLEAACGRPVELDVSKITSAEMDAFLREKLGIGLEETRKVGLDSFIYLPDFDAYYNVAGDTNYEPCTVTGGWRRDNGTMLLDYEMGGEERSVYMRKTGEGAYIFLWNANLARG